MNTNWDLSIFYESFSDPQLREILSEMDPLEANSDINALSPHARSFHAALTAISGQKRIIRAIEGQDEYITRFSALSIAKEDRRIEAHKEHHELVNLVEKRDLEGFEQLMRQHIERSTGPAYRPRRVRWQRVVLP